LKDEESKTKKPISIFVDRQTMLTPFSVSFFKNYKYIFFF